MWKRFLLQLGMMTIVNLVNSDDKDTAELQAEIAAADEEDVKEIVEREGKKLADEVVGEDVLDEMISELAGTRTPEDVKVVTSQPKIKLNILQGLADFLGGLVKALFGG